MAQKLSYWISYSWLKTAVSYDIIFKLNASSPFRYYKNLFSTSVSAFSVPFYTTQIDKNIPDICIEESYYLFYSGCSHDYILALINDNESVNDYEETDLH